MPIPQDKLHTLIEKSFPDADIDIVDLAGDDDHYSVTITDSSFAGKSRIEQHKLVNKALGDRLGGELHAMALKTIAK
jgi:stress-induced morphogen